MTVVILAVHMLLKTNTVCEKYVLRVELFTELFYSIIRYFLPLNYIYIFYILNSIVQVYALPSYLAYVTRGCAIWNSLCSQAPLPIKCKKLRMRVP